MTPCPKQQQNHNLQFGSRGATALEDLVSLLCDSAKVKRPCRMMLRRPMDYSKQSTDRGGDTPAYLSLTVGGKFSVSPTPSFLLPLEIKSCNI